MSRIDWSKGWLGKAPLGNGFAAPVWITWLPEVECEECHGGVCERIVGERRVGMGGIEPVIREYPCEECEDGLLPCVECGIIPSYNAPSYDRLCASCLAVATKNVG